MEYRCQKHDVLFQTAQAIPPGYRNRDNDSDPNNQPSDCHNDCPVGKRERAGKKYISKQLIEAQARTKGISVDLASQQAVAAGYEIGEQPAQGA